MTATDAETPASAIVLGARNLGGWIARDLLAHGVKVAIVARSQQSLDALEEHGALTLQADAADPRALQETLSRAASELGSVELVVNAMSPGPPPANEQKEFGGGPLIDATMLGFQGWTVAFARLAFVALQAGIRALQPHGGTMVQIVGAPARRAAPGRGLIAAGSAAVRAMTHAAAAEVRGAGVHVALLIVDGIIESPKTAKMAQGMPHDALVRQPDVSAAVRFLGSQTARGMTHELVLTPAGGLWLPS